MAILLILAAILPQLPALHGEFQWDDDPHIVLNRNVRDFPGLVRTWTEPRSNIQYYPVSITAFWIEYQLWGLDTTGYHAVNFALHAANVLLVWLILTRLRAPWPWLVALCFALHPVMVESVAYISELKNLMSGLFFLLCILTWFQWMEAKPGAQRIACYVALILFYIIGMLAKEIVCTLPATLLVITFWKKGRITRRDILPTLPLFVVGAAFALMFAHMEHTHVGAQGGDFNFTLVMRALIAGRAVWFYLWKFLWPHPLMIVYPRWDMDTTLWLQYVPPVGVVALLASLWVFRRRLGRGLFSAMVIFLVTVSPSLGLVNYYPMVFTFVADHYAYMAAVPLLAFYVALVHGLIIRFAHPSTVSLRKIHRALACGATVVLGLLTLSQASAWKTKASLWGQAAQRNPHSWMVLENYAQGENLEGHFEEAAKSAAEATHRRPSEARPYQTLGEALVHLNDFSEAILPLQRGVELEPQSVPAWANLGLALENVGRIEEAQAAYQNALAIDPTETSTLVKLSALRLHMKDFPRAEQAARKAVQINENIPAARVNLGLALEQQQRYPEALEQLGKGLALIPGNSRVRLEVARVLVHLGRLPEAANEYTRVIAQSPQLDAARTELAELQRHLSEGTPSQRTTTTPQ